MTTHPIQYQTPLWKALAKSGRVPFEVWYLTHHGVQPSFDPQFGKAFAWDIDMLSGYQSRLLPTPPHASPSSFWRSRTTGSLTRLLRNSGAKALWIQGWQVMGYWQAAWSAKAAGCELWLRGESNDLAPSPKWKLPAKHLLLHSMFDQVDRFLCIGKGNKRLYEKYGVSSSKLFDAPYAVDNDRFSHQAAIMRPHRSQFRRGWAIEDNAFVVLFCGKFIEKKRPHDLIDTALALQAAGRPIHLLFVGSGELGEQLRRRCNVVHDADSPRQHQENKSEGQGPKASFAGFLNQTEVSKAYVAADCLVLPSSFGETWGLVVNEAMASGLPCMISNRCGSAEDLGSLWPNQVFPFGDIEALSVAIAECMQARPDNGFDWPQLSKYSLSRVVDTVEHLAVQAGIS